MRSLVKSTSVSILMPSLSSLSSAMLLMKICSACTIASHLQIYLLTSLPIFLTPYSQGDHELSQIATDLKWSPPSRDMLPAVNSCQHPCQHLLFLPDLASALRHIPPYMPPTSRSGDISHHQSVDTCQHLSAWKSSICP